MTSDQLEQELRHRKMAGIIYIKIDNDMSKVLVQEGFVDGLVTTSIHKYQPDILAVEMLGEKLLKNESFSNAAQSIYNKCQVLKNQQVLEQDSNELDLD